MKQISWLVLAVLLASCSNDWSAGLGSEGRRGVASSPGSSAAALVAATASGAAVQGTRQAGSFANAPDHGSLVDYPSAPVVRRDGAYTWHAAALSEDHAWRSTVTGTLSFTAPDGTPIQLAYDRHVEHPDGNWSWIGRVPGEQSESTVITFGQTAAFGNIPQRGGLPPLRLTTSDGRAWVVSTDPRLLREVRNEATHPTKPDFLIPPKLASARSSSGMQAVGAQMMGAQAVAATVGGKTIVDVLVGYTPGLTERRGGELAAVTRVHNLIDITNQAYVNSEVNAEARVVHTMLVNYPDTTSNKTALQEMTGFEAPSTQTTPAAAFSALRAARDQYGADLVVLLRPFQSPEHDSCGVAWLIGGGRSGIEASDQYFGYSVVSDGADGGYQCRDETVAHELGHNMGSQHDIGNAKDDDGETSYGVYSYSFGHKTTSSGGDFYTVMAYGDSGQTSYRVFSNPVVTSCGGVQCGVFQDVDNARSLNQTVPLIAAFRSSVDAVPAPVRTASNDVNNDLKSDLLWFKPGVLQIWQMSGYSISSEVQYSPASNLIPYAIGEWNDVAGADIAWRDQNGALIFWVGQPAYTRSSQTYAMSFGWRLQAAGDRNGDGQSDFFWRSAADGRVMYWHMGPGQQLLSYAAFAQDPAFGLIATGDYNGDGATDLLFHRRNDGLMSIWLASGNGFEYTEPGAISKYWRPSKSGDYDGDGDDDLVWRSAIDNRVMIWIMQGGLRVDYRVFNSDADRALLTSGDFNGDGLSDLVWRRTDGAVSMWLNTGDGYVSRYIGSRDSSWSLARGGL